MIHIERSEGRVVAGSANEAAQDERSAVMMPCSMA